MGLIISLVGGLWDAFTGRIPNWLTIGSIVLGLVFHAFTGKMVWCLLGLLAGIMIYWPFFSLGYMGGGDVKMMGAIGCFAGLEGVIYTALLASLWGGVMALVALIQKKKYIRYGVAIGLGYLTLQVLLWSNWQLPFLY